jgi:hypothetical protein
MQFLRPDSIHRWTEGDYTIVTDHAAVDHDVVYRFLEEQSYWARGRGRERMEHSIRYSRPYVLRHIPTDAQVGFARVVTDGEWFAWIADVFVLADHRGGRGKFLMRCIMEDLAEVRRITLGTRDAHGLYAQFGFGPLPNPDGVMERHLQQDW